MAKSFYKKRIFLICLLLISFFLISSFFSVVVLAEREDFSGYNQMDLSLEISNKIIVQGTAKYLEAILSWYPRQSYRQESTIDTSGKLVNNEFVFHWNDPSSEEEVFLKSRVKTTDDFVLISKKIPYPSEIPRELKTYLLPGEIIDTNKDIERLSLILTTNVDDYYEAVFNIADWVTTNIRYDLNTIAADATEKSSWVLKNKYGVCDEMTSLFISLLRDAGIPARFVSGIAYTNLESLDAWGPHGWAEVYFLGKGWIPFDVTYGEYGYVDATHIKLKDSVDTKDHNVEYSMLSKDASFQALDFEQKVVVNNKKKFKKSNYKVNLEIYDSSVDSDSYNLLTVKIKSLVPYYTSSRFQLAQTQGLEILGNREKNLFFKPYEEKKFYFVIKQTSPLQKGYYVTYPLKLFSARTELANSSFKAEKNEDYYDLNYFKPYLKVDSSDSLEEVIPIVCKEKIVYEGESFTIDCEVSTSEEGKAKVCVGGMNAYCDYQELPNITLNLRCDSTGLKAKSVSVQKLNSGLKANGLLKYECLDKASVIINLLNISKELEYNDQGIIVFSLEPNSSSIPRNVSIVLSHDNFNKSWFADSLTVKNIFELKFLAKSLDLKNNDFKILVSFEDELGKRFVEEKSFKIGLVNLTLKNKFMIYLYEIERFLEKQVEKIS